MTDTLHNATPEPRLSDYIEAVLSQIDPNEVIEFHRALVRIPSINPPGDVREASAVVAAKLAAEGFAVTEVTELEPMPNLLATKSWGDGLTLAFNAHLDVVPIGERSAWTYDPFGADMHEGRIYGRGAGDDKASVAAQVMAAIALARANVPLAGTLVVNEVADEEVAGIHGTKYVVDSGALRPDFVIVGEQTLNRIALGEKGSAGTTIRIHGRTAHGALPWEGANAIEAAGVIIAALRRELMPELERRTHPHFHPSSASINLFQGGVKSNVVPDYAEIFIDRRLIPGEDPATERDLMGDIARNAVADWEGISIDVEMFYLSRPATWTDEQSPLAQAALAANARLGLSTDVTGFSMATDGRYFAWAGVPTIIYGPGDPKLAHIPDEWVGIDEIIEATRFYAVAAVHLLSGLDSTEDSRDE